ncbi:HutD family protein [Thermomonas sp. S9]|uniref:HutD/Ves family protein n=1 Tax=Thermomonas sp. S9 TaxID=2885203 RepID=UPI00216AF805|nr:HutD family protein [Thermomonas sp. S9]MCR6496458.1 HutD family protein [Thermomonas sp. S9]
MSADCACGGAVTTGQDAPPCGVRILRATDYRRMRWKNGAGWTSEVLRMPEREDWDWRLSLAEIDQDAPFSGFPGMERLLVLLQGDGLRMHFEDGRTQELRPPHGMLRFSGDRPVRAELLGGPCRDFGLIWKRGQVDVQLWHRPLAGAMVLFASTRETWLLHLLEGLRRWPATVRPARWRRATACCWKAGNCQPGCPWKATGRPCWRG